MDLYKFPFNTSMIIIARWFFGSLVVWTPFLISKDMPMGNFLIITAFGINAGLLDTLQVSSTKCHLEVVTNKNQFKLARIFSGLPMI